MALRWEAWTLPTASTFERKIADIPVRNGKGYDQFGDGGEGSMVVPAEYDRLSEIISDTEGSLIRVYDGSTLVHEWVAERVEYDVEDSSLVHISGDDLHAFPGRAVVYPFDYPDQPTKDPDWQWGSDDNLITNGTFENDSFLTNTGFEDGTVNPWAAGLVAGVDANLAIETTEVDSGSFSAKCTPLNSGGGMSAAVGNLIAGKDYTVSVRVKTTASESMQIGASGPVNILVITGDQVAEVTAAPDGYEAQQDFSASGSWETVQLVFRTAPGQTRSQISIRNNTGSPDVFYVDDVTVSGEGVGMEGWNISPWDADINFTASTDVTAHSGSLTGKVTAPDGGGIFTQIEDVDKGATYTITAWVRTSLGTDRWTLDVIDELYRRLGQDSVVASTTWQKLEVEIEVLDDLPGEREIFIGLRNDSGSTATGYFDDVTVIRGKPASTVGTILTDLMDDATSDHSGDTRGTILTWLDYSGFDATNDSGSTAWADNLTFTAYRGDTYLNVFRSLRKLGYEWNITAKATPSGGQTHDLNFYEPDGLGTDYTDSDTPAVVYGQNTPSASVVKRVPRFTAILAEGEAGAYAESEDATTKSNFGRWESYSQYIDTTSTTQLGTIGSEQLDNEDDNRAAIKIRVLAGDNPRPFVDFKAGDTLNWQVPPLVTRESRKVQRIAYARGEPDYYDLTGSRVFPGETGIREAVRKLLQLYDPLRRRRQARNQAVDFAPSDGGGAPTLVVAASDSTVYSKNRADFLCDGTDDHVEIQAAVDAIQNEGGIYTPRGGRVILCEGTYSISTGQIDLDENIHLLGLGAFESVLSTTDNSGYMVTTGSDCIVENINFDGNTGPDAIDVGGSNVLIKHCHFNTINVAIDLTSGTRYIITQCRSNTTTTFVQSSAGTSNVLIVDNLRVRDIVHASTGSNQTGWVVAGNLLEGQIDFGELDSFIVADNIWMTVNGANDAAVTIDSCNHGVLSGNVGDDMAGYDAVAVSSSDHIIITGNSFDQITHGILFTTVTKSRVSDNIFGGDLTGSFLGEDGVELNASSDNDVFGNIINEPSDDTNNTHDGVLITGDANRNYVHHNRVFPATASPQPRYGINVATTDADDNILIHNWLGSTGDYATGVLNDQGSNTVTTDPGGSYGDNYTI